MQRMNIHVRFSILMGLALLTAILSAKAAGPSSLVFDPGLCTTETLTVKQPSFKYRSCLNIVYVSNPVRVTPPLNNLELTTYHIMNFYYPEAYDKGGSINGYTGETAPIFFRMTVGGYSQAPPATISTESVQRALLRSYVVASPGVRGIQTKDAEGLRYVGKAPACIVDMKAAIRYLRHNDKAMPGDAGKIISSGSSASGALSALLGATGNNSDYEPYLKALGAADERDDILAASCYCPITNLENADIAYEWQFNGSTRLEPQRDGTNPLPLTQIEHGWSNDLKALFPAYLDQLGLVAYEPRNDKKAVGAGHSADRNKKGALLTEAANGNGIFTDYVASFVVAAAQKALDAGANLSGFDYLTLSQDGKTVTGIDFWKYSDTRMKRPPAFDTMDLSIPTPEVQLFGAVNVNARHFTQYSLTKDPVSALADKAIVKMLNPMCYIDAQKTTIAHYWRIRHGTIDRHTSLAIPVILATMLANKGCDVDFALSWNTGHGGDYDLPELFAWIDMISHAPRR